MEYDIIFALHPLSSEEPATAAEQLLDAFVSANPATPAVGSVNGAENVFDLAITLEAASADDAFETAKPLILRALTESELESRPIAAIEVHAADVEPVAV